MNPDEEYPNSITITRTRKVKNKQTGAESNENLVVKEYYVRAKSQEGMDIIDKWNGYFNDENVEFEKKSNDNAPTSFVEEYYDAKNI